jgi:hypothetical protein
MDTSEAEQRLFEYMRAKTTQIDAERAYGLIFGTHQRLERFLYPQKLPGAIPHRLIGTQVTRDK